MRQGTINIIIITNICTYMHLDCTTQVGTHTHTHMHAHTDTCAKHCHPSKLHPLTWTECWHWRGPRHCHQHRHTSKQTHLDGVPPHFKILTWTEYHHASKQSHLDRAPPCFKTLTWTEYHHTSKLTHLDRVLPHFKTDSPGQSTIPLQN